MRCFWTSCILLLVAGLLSAQEKREVSELDLLLENYQTTIQVQVDAPHDAAVEDLTAKYKAALLRKQKSFQGEGQLEHALAFKREIERVDGSESDQEEETGDTPHLDSLRAVYEQALESIEQETETRRLPIDRQLLGDLDSLKKSLTVAGRLEDAVVVAAKREELATDASETALSGGSPDQPSDEGDLGEWLEGQELYWPATNADEIVMLFSNNRVRVLADGREIMRERITLTSENAFTFEWFGTSNTFTLKPGKRSFIREMPNGQHEGKVRPANG